MDISRTGRFALGAAVVVAVSLGTAGVVMAVDDPGNSTSPPATTIQEAQPVDSTAAPITAPVTEAPPVTIAKGFENYQPGDALPEAPPAPTPDEPTVSTVPGPYGPVYPDGYTNGDTPPPRPDPGQGLAP